MKHRLFTLLLFCTSFNVQAALSPSVSGLSDKLAVSVAPPNDFRDNAPEAVCLEFLTVELDEDGNNSLLPADISGLKAGVYVFRIQLADGRPVARRLVVR